MLDLAAALLHSLWRKAPVAMRHFEQQDMDQMPTNRTPTCSMGPVCSFLQSSLHCQHARLWFGERAAVICTSSGSFPHHLQYPFGMMGKEQSDIHWVRRSRPRTPPDATRPRDASRNERRNHHTRRFAQSRSPSSSSSEAYSDSVGSGK